MLTQNITNTKSARRKQHTLKHIHSRNMFLLAHEAKQDKKGEMKKRHFVCLKCNENRNNSTMYFSGSEKYRQFTVASTPFHSQSFRVSCDYWWWHIILTLIPWHSITFTAQARRCSAFKWHFCNSVRGALHFYLKWAFHCFFNSSIHIPFHCIALNCSHCTSSQMSHKDRTKQIRWNMTIFSARKW